MKLVSVIVPVYKAEKYINQCVESISNQSYRNLQIILVDDGSPDSCPQICEVWKEKDFRVQVIHQKNSGVSAARNTGVAMSLGEYIVMVDSDDYIAPDMIETMVDIAEKNSAEMVISDYATGEIRDYKFENRFSAKIEEISAETAMLRSYEDAHKALQYIAPWCKLYQRKLFEGLVYPTGKIFEDIYLTHQLLWKASKITVIHKEFSYYYHHDDSIMHKKFHVGKLDYLEALSQRISFFQEQGKQELEKIAYAEYLHSLIWEYSRARDLIANREAMKDIRQRFQKTYRLGYCSNRYKEESGIFLFMFNLNPELIILYWKINGKLKSLRRGI